MDAQDVDGLVIRARHDADALGSLYERHYDRVFGYCMRRLFVREIAEDATAATFLNVARHIRAFPGTTEQAFRNWVYAIATNEINTWIRTTKRRESLLTAAMRERVAIGTVRAESQADLEPLDWPALYEAILRLTPPYQSVVVLRFWEGLDHRTIAEVLGYRPMTVRVMLARAIRKLRRSLQARMD